jgi:hypothetical protein
MLGEKIRHSPMRQLQTSFQSRSSRQISSKVLLGYILQKGQQTTEPAEVALQTGEQQLLAGGRRG